MSAKNKRTPAAQTSPALAPQPAAAAAPATAVPAPFYLRHPQAANVIFAAFCVYVAMIWLLALDQTFHWGIFGPVVPPVP